MRLEKLIATICDTSDLTDAEVREELAEQGIDLDAEMAKFRPKLDDLMRARAVRLALAAVKDNPPHIGSPLPWYNDNKLAALYCHSGFEVYGRHGYKEDRACIAARVNSAPLLAAEVKRLQEPRWVENRIDQVPDSIALFLIIGDVAHAEIFKVSGRDSWSWWSRLEQNRYVGTLEEAKAATLAEARRALGLEVGK